MNWIHEWYFGVTILLAGHAPAGRFLNLDFKASRTFPSSDVTIKGCAALSPNCIEGLSVRSRYR